MGTGALCLRAWVFPVQQAAMVGVCSLVCVYTLVAL